MKKKNKNKVIVPNVIRGGQAIPLGANYYYMKGRKHNNGGIDIGENPKTGLEVEDGEVMKMTPNEVKVYSSVPFLNGKSPAQKVLVGENPNKVFKQQEEYKDRNGIKDDGTKAEIGKYFNQNTLDKVNNSWIATGIKMLDPTGISSWYDVKRAIDDYKENPNTNNSINLTTEFIGAIPIIGKIGKAMKAMKAVEKAAKGKQLNDIEKVLVNYAKKNKKQVIKRSAVGKSRNIVGGGKDIYDSATQNMRQYGGKSVNKITRMGGLNRSKDYGSKSKPYPKVDKKDFAGSNRTYPIPTKADAIDALRLAGLHGRSDIRSKVYNKYPELRKKARTGMIYSLTNNGKTNLRMLSSTGSRTKAELGFVRFFRDIRDSFAKGLEKSRENQTKTPTYFRKNKTVKQVQQEVKRANANTSRGFAYLNNITNNNKIPLFYPKNKSNYYITQKTNNVSTKNIKRNNNSNAKDINKVQSINIDRDVLRQAETQALINNIDARVNYNQDKGLYNPIKGTNIIDNIDINKKKCGGRKRAEYGIDFWENLAKEQEKEKRKIDLNNKLSGNYNFNNAVILNTNNIPKSEDTVIKGTIDNLNIPNYIPTYNKNNKSNNSFTKIKNSIGNYFKDGDNISDTISLSGNILGNIISSGINRNMINNIQMPNKSTAPINKRATKLKTKININPQLTNMRESLAAYEKNVDENTSSSQVALSRKQRARIANLLNTNTLYANKENQETSLINQDRLNQQSVDNANVESYNNYLDKLTDYENRKTELENKKIELSAENKVATIENINSAIQNLISNKQKRNSEKQTVAAMSFANPNLPAEMLYAQGLISKETYEAYRKAYPLKNKVKENI